MQIISWTLYLGKRTWYEYYESLVCKKEVLSRSIKDAKEMDGIHHLERIWKVMIEGLMKNYRL